MSDYRSMEAKRQKKNEAKAKWNFYSFGRTTMGKSSTGNTILGKKSFPVRSIQQTSDLTIKYDHVTTEHGETLNVIDASGICDSAQDRAESRNGRRSTMKSDLATFREIFVKRVGNALTTVATIVLFVFKFGSGRFTSQEKNAVRQVKTLFGEDVFRKFGVMIVTGGDTYENNDDYPDFDQWIREQTGDFGELVKECNGRCVLFNNVTGNEEKKRQQMARLWRCAEEVRQTSNGELLTWSDEGMEELIWSHDLDALNEEIKSFHQRLADIESDSLSKTRNKLEKVITVRRDVAMFKTKDKGYDIAFTGRLNLLQDRIDRLAYSYAKELQRKRNCNIMIVVAVAVTVIVVIGVLCGTLTKLN